MKDYVILVINPGSTSTKVAFFVNEDEVVAETIRHDSSEIARYDGIVDQLNMRMIYVDMFLINHRKLFLGASAVAARGGILHPVPSGVYRVNEAMLEDLSSARYGEHASNLGAIMANVVAKERDHVCEAYVADPVVVDEMDAPARVTGLPSVSRISRFHALNHKSVARAAARDMGKRYEDVNLIVAHMGGGVSVGAHRHGRVVDVNNALYGDGPFSPERAGGLPTGELLEMCFKGEEPPMERCKRIRSLLAGKGGLVAHLGTNSLEEARRMSDSGDTRATLVLDAMAYQVAKEICGLAAASGGAVDGVVLTGGMASDEKLIRYISDRVGFLAEVKVYPGEREMISLAGNVLEVLKGEAEPREYKKNEN